MLQPYHRKFSRIGLFFAHTGIRREGGNNIYSLAAAVISPDGPEEAFASHVLYEHVTARDRHASGISRDMLRIAPSPADVAAYLSSFLRQTEVVLSLNSREQIEALLVNCGNPRIVDLRFAAEFFLPQADNTALKPLWEHLHGKPREKFSFTAQEAVALSLDLVRHICGHILNPSEFPPASALRFYMDRSDTLFGDLFLYLNRRFRDYFGGLFDPSSGGDTEDWKQYLQKAPHCVSNPEREDILKTVPLAHIRDLYRTLAAKSKDHAFRHSQVVYAGHVASALNDRAVLTIEAGTGTGKTQGYLIPVMEFLRRNKDARLAVSTYTKNLQEQIVRREIPLTVSLNRAYRKIRVALLKGKSNYICAEKLEQFYDDDIGGLRLIAWLYFVNRVFYFREADGDTVGERIRFHLNDGFFFRRLQHEISARSGCSRRHIRCPAQIVAAEAKNARLIVTNHHKLALIDRDEIVHGGFENCVIDEANHFEQAVRAAYRIEVSSREIADTIAYLRFILKRLTPPPMFFQGKLVEMASAAIDEFQKEIEKFGDAIASVCAKAAPGEEMVLPEEHAAFRESRLKNHLDDLRRMLKRMISDLSFFKDQAVCMALGIRVRTVDRMRTAVRDLQETEETLKAVGEKIASKRYVTAGVRYVRHWTISVRAVEVAEILHDHIYNGRDCVIFTSATLCEGGSFDGFRRVAGMDRCLCADDFPAGSGREEDPMPSEGEGGGRVFRFEAVPSPFSGNEREILVPPEAVSGAFENKDGWLSRVSQILPELIHRNRGRTLVLFASYGDLETVVSRVSEKIQDDGYPLLVQRNGIATTALCDEFRAIRESVLFGVDTFWFGVDFPGDTLTQVIITRIPFPHPQDPLQVARRKLLIQDEYWKRYRYETEIKMRQGIGRLIRSEKDRGRVVILDSRYRRNGGI